MCDIWLSQLDARRFNPIVLGVFLFSDSEFYQDGLLEMYEICFFLAFGYKL